MRPWSGLTSIFETMLPLLEMAGRGGNRVQQHWVDSLTSRIKLVPLRALASKRHEAYDKGGMNVS